MFKEADTADGSQRFDEEKKIIFLFLNKMIWKERNV
jgi:hypothetical protein